MVQNATPKTDAKTTAQSKLQDTNKTPNPTKRKTKSDWARLDDKLIILMNRILTKALRHNELDKTETTILLNYDKLRQVGNKPLGTTKAPAELSDSELEQALGKKPEV